MTVQDPELEAAYGDREVSQEQLTEVVGRVFGQFGIELQNSKRFEIDPVNVGVQLGEVAETAQFRPIETVDDLLRVDVRTTAGGETRTIEFMVSGKLTADEVRQVASLTNGSEKPMVWEQSGTISTFRDNPRQTEFVPGESRIVDDENYPERHPGAHAKDTEGPIGYIEPRLGPRVDAKAALQILEKILEQPKER